MLARSEKYTKQQVKKLTDQGVKKAFEFLEKESWSTRKKRQYAKDLGEFYGCKRFIEETASHKALKIVENLLKQNTMPLDEIVQLLEDPVDKLTFLRRQRWTDTKITKKYPELKTHCTKKRRIEN